MTPKEILIAARAKIESPENWTRGGGRARTEGPHCSQTAIYPATAETYRDALPAMTLLASAMGIDSDQSCILGLIWNWNDRNERTHAEVLAAFDRAIAAA